MNKEERPQRGGGEGCQSHSFLPSFRPAQQQQQQQQHSTSRPLKICMQRRFIDFSSFFRSQTAFVDPRLRSGRRRRIIMS